MKFRKTVSFFVCVLFMVTGVGIGSAFASRVVELPGWLENMDFSGSLRVRYQTESSETNNVTRDRARIRLLMGVDTEINEKLEVGVGFEAGSTDARSANATLEDGFETVAFLLDYAYATYKPFCWMSVTAGKFKNPFFSAKDLLWDTDIRPNGVVVKFGHYITRNLELYATPAFLIVDEKDTPETNQTNDPSAFVFQTGINVHLVRSGYLNFAASYYDFINLKGSDYNSTTNSTRTASNGNTTNNSLYQADYDAFVLDLAFGFKKLPIPIIPHIGVFGQFVFGDNEGINNDEDTGYLIGITMGKDKLEKLGDLKLTYSYRNLEADAWPDFLPDADCFVRNLSSGSAGSYAIYTDVRAHEIEYEFGLAKNVSAKMDMYLTKNDRDIEYDEVVTQYEVNIKW
jgi:hypothetical protein